MSDKLLLLTYFIFGIIIFYKVFSNRTDKKNDTMISVWYFVPVWVMLMIQMWMNMWHGIG